ncbi:MAG: Crp/Fnr family transcriptional regulator [Sphaerochaetaceae bacterium]|nr:Crp/Fnr family transcriptional regulator [Sphaerochaetaceae bacterium]
MDKNICGSTFTDPLVTNKKFEEIVRPYVVIKKLAAKTNFLDLGDIVSGVYYIKSGRTKHYIIGEDGSEKILYTLSTGWLFGETSEVLNVPTGLISETMENSEIWIIPHSAFSTLFNTNQIVRNAVMVNVCRKLRILRYDIEMLSFHPVKERILHLFCSTANPSELIDGKWYALYNKYTHYEVSTIIGSARVTTSKLINELCEDGAIRQVNHKIQVSKAAYDKMMNLCL